ncbi:MAG: hypothetical protein ACC628_02375, partial [Pirellulaceae bacterium]
MATNGDILLATLRSSTREWRGIPKDPDSRNETAFVVMVVEPTLSALGWRRLRKDEAHTSGAFYEWRKYPGVDLALLRNGAPTLIGEFVCDSKKGVRHCLDQLTKRFTQKEYATELRNMRMVMTGWGGKTDGSGDVALALHRRTAAGTIARVEEAQIIPLNGISLPYTDLASAAFPVLCEGVSPSQWLASSSGREEPRPARCNP